MPAEDADSEHLAAQRAAPAAKPDRRRERGKRRETAMVDAARALFIERGYRGTTLDAIIAESGGSRETVYRVFGGKRGLLSTIISQVGDPIAAGLDEQSAETPPREVLLDLGMQLMAFWLSAEGRAMNRLVFSDGIDTPEVVEVWYNSAVRPSMQALTRYLERQATAKRAEVNAPAVVARQFLLLLMAETAFHTILPAEQPSDTGEMLARSVDLVFGRR